MSDIERSRDPKQYVKRMKLRGQRVGTNCTPPFYHDSVVSSKKAVDFVQSPEQLPFPDPDDQ